jgi:transcriptional regulator GlxA family with amidase domain
VQKPLSAFGRGWFFVFRLRTRSEAVVTSRFVIRAVELLEQMPNRPVAEIARLVGFEDPFYFSRQFHKHIGHSPSASRNL